MINVVHVSLAVALKVCKRGQLRPEVEVDVADVVCGWSCRSAKPGNVKQNHLILLRVGGSGGVMKVRVSASCRAKRPRVGKGVCREEIRIGIAMQSSTSRGRQAVDPHLV